MKNLYSVSLYFIGLLSLSTCCLNDNALEDNQEQIPVSFFLNEREVVNLNKTKNTDIPEDNEKEIVIVTDKSEWKQKALSDLRTTWVTGASGISNLAWKQGDEMGIYMRSSSDKTKTLGQDNVRYRVEKGEKQTNIHSVNSSLYFFNTTTNVTFFAYYPYIQSQGGNLLVNYTLPVNQTNQTDLVRADIMYSNVLQANGAKPNVVLSFNHKMVLLSFKVSTRTSAVSKLTKITISGSKVTNTGTLDLSTGLIATKPAMASFVVNPNKDMSSAISAYVDVIINPCTIGNNNVVGSEEFKVTFTIELGSLAAHPSSTLMLYGHLSKEVSVICLI